MVLITMYRYLHQMQVLSTFMNLKGRSHLRDLDVDGRIIVKRMEIGFDGMNWIHDAEFRNQWRAPVNTGMNLRVP
jgi:hypothetical protein